jgi:RNA polymerase sigma-70 factor (ECF subfamily)
MVKPVGALYPESAPEFSSGEALVQRLLPFHERSFSFALRCCRGDREEAADVLQHAYAAVLGGRGSQFRGESELKTWWFGVLRQMAFGWFRTVSRRARRLLEAPAPEEFVNAEQHLQAKERSRKIAALLHQLPDAQRLPLHLYFYEEMTLEQIGAVLGISAKTTVQSRIKAGQKQLETLLSAEGIQ